MSESEHDERLNLEAARAYIAFGSSRAAARAVFSSHSTILRRLRAYARSHSLDQLRQSMFRLGPKTAPEQTTASYTL